MVGLGVDSYNRARVHLHEGFRPQRMDAVAAALIRAQQLAALRSGHDDRPAALLLTPESTKSYRRTRSISTHRVQAVLHTIELERNMTISFAEWATSHGMRWFRV